MLAGGAADIDVDDEQLLSLTQGCMLMNYTACHSPFPVLRSCSKVNTRRPHSAPAKHIRLAPKKHYGTALRLDTANSGMAHHVHVLLQPTHADKATAI